MHDPQWESNPKPVILSPTPYPLDHMLQVSFCTWPENDYSHLHCALCLYQHPLIFYESNLRLYTLCKKATIHLVATMLAASKMSYFQVITIC